MGESQRGSTTTIARRRVKPRETERKKKTHVHPEKPSYHRAGTNAHCDYGDLMKDKAGRRKSLTD
jgi:hypothetical protein